MTADNHDDHLEEKDKPFFWHGFLLLLAYLIFIHIIQNVSLWKVVKCVLDRYGYSSIWNSKVEYMKGVKGHCQLIGTFKWKPDGKLAPVYVPDWRVASADPTKKHP